MDNNRPNGCGEYRSVTDPFYYGDEGGHDDFSTGSLRTREFDKMTFP